MSSEPYDRLSMVKTISESSVTPIFRNPDWTTIENTREPWLYTCGLTGALKLQVQLAPADSPRGQYRVVLHFCELRAASDEGMFDVVLQGETVLRNLNIAKQAGGRNRPLILPFITEAAERLSLELVPRTGIAPVISAMQIEALPMNNGNVGK
jgi:hypothetical protein